MPILSFEGENEGKIFQMLFDGFIIGGALIKEKGINVIRREASLLDKLESISKECECGRRLVTGEAARELLDNNNKFIIDLSLDEFNILQNYFEAVPWKSSLSRDVVKISDWLDSFR